MKHKPQTLCSVRRCYNPRWEKLRFNAKPMRICWFHICKLMGWPITSHADLTASTSNQKGEASNDASLSTSIRKDIEPMEVEKMDRCMECKCCKAWEAFVIDKAKREAARKPAQRIINRARYPYAAD